MSRTVVHVVPHLPPPPDGVGSHALSLAAALAAEHGVASRFLVASPAGSPIAERGGAEARVLPRREAGALIAGLDEAISEAEGRGAGEVAVLLHYANYAYEPRGCPSWLVEGLTRWKARSGLRLSTLFHEVHAMGPPWRSSFWLSPRQRRLAASLASLSDGLVTSMDYYRRILQRWVPGKEIDLLPIFSSMGEPADTLLLAQRTPRMVVFGGAGTRALAYRELIPALEVACRKLGIEEIIDVGPGGETAAPPRLSVPWRRLGPLPEGEVSALLASSKAGFVGYPAPFLPKSSIFAAYCAHRILPVSAWRWPRRRVEVPPPSWRPDPETDASPDALQELADRAHHWYFGHRLSQHAAHHTRILFPS